MSRHERTRESEARPASEGPGDGRARSEEQRRRAERLLSVSDEAIDRFQSGDSERFLRDLLQTGGQ